MRNRPYEAQSSVGGESGAWAPIAHHYVVVGVGVVVVVSVVVASISLTLDRSLCLYIYQYLYKCQCGGVADCAYDYRVCLGMPIVPRNTVCASHCRMRLLVTSAPPTADRGS